MQTIQPEPTAGSLGQGGADTARMAGLVTRRQRLSERYAVLYPLAVRANRVRRRLRWVLGDEVWAEHRPRRRAA